MCHIRFILRIILIFEIFEFWAGNFKMSKCHVFSHWIIVEKHKRTKFINGLAHTPSEIVRKVFKIMCSYLYFLLPSRWPLPSSPAPFSHKPYKPTSLPGWWWWLACRIICSVSPSPCPLDFWLKIWDWGLGLGEQFSSLFKCWIL